MTSTIEDFTGADIIDVRDVIERIEELESIVGDDHDAANQDDASELAQLESLMSDLADCGGGNEQWRGTWYPLLLISESHFRDYAEQLAEDIGAINAAASWPNCYIDWDRAADALRMDYTPVTFNSVEYWTR